MTEKINPARFRAFVSAWRQFSPAAPSPLGERLAAIAKIVRRLPRMEVHRPVELAPARLKLLGDALRGPLAKARAKGGMAIIYLSERHGSGMRVGTGGRYDQNNPRYAGGGGNDPGTKRPIF